MFKKCSEPPSPVHPQTPPSSPIWVASEDSNICRYRIHQSCHRANGESQTLSASALITWSTEPNYLNHYFSLCLHEDTKTDNVARRSFTGMTLRGAGRRSMAVIGVGLEHLLYVSQRSPKCSLPQTCHGVELDPLGWCGHQCQFWTPLSSRLNSSTVGDFFH